MSRTSVIYFIVNSLVLTFERAQSAPFFSVLRIAFIHHCVEARLIESAATLSVAA